MRLNGRLANESWRLGYINSIDVNLKNEDARSVSDMRLDQDKFCLSVFGWWETTSIFRDMCPNNINSECFPDTRRSTLTIVLSCRKQGKFCYLKKTFFTRRLYAGVYVTCSVRAFDKHRGSCPQSQRVQRNDGSSKLNEQLTRNSKRYYESTPSKLYWVQDMICKITA